MDNPAALHRIKVGVPATVEHSSEAGPETGKWIAETTQVWYHSSVSTINLHLFLRALSPSWMDFAFEWKLKINCIQCSKNWLLVTQDSKEARIGRGAVGWFPGEFLKWPLSNPHADIACARLITLNGMKASDELTEEQSRQAWFSAVAFASY